MRVKEKQTTSKIISENYLVCSEKSSLNSLGEELGISGAQRMHCGTVSSIPLSFLTSVSNYVARALVLGYGVTCCLDLGFSFT